MHNRRVFVYKNINYAASKTSATVNTAITADQLADGAVAIYGIHETGSTNLNKLVLITDGGSESAGIVPAASFVGKEVQVALGTATGVQLSAPIQLATVNGPVGLIRAYGTKYVAPVRGILRIGYNGTAGTTLGITTIARGDDFNIGLFNRNYFVSGGREPGQKVELSASAVTGDTQYTLLKTWMAKLNLRTDEVLIDKTLAKILHNGTGAVFTNTATVAGVNGATTLTTSAAHGVTAGDSISLNGDFYITAAGTTGSTLVLDRPYQQATGTVASANTLDITVQPTAYGVELVDNADFRNLEGAVGGIAQNANILRYQLPLPGEGSYQGILNYEKEALPKKGTEALTDATVPHDAYRAVSGTTYDLYILTVRNSGQPSGAGGAVFNVNMITYLAFVSGVADTTALAQSDFEDAMTSLFGAAFPQISA